MIKKQYARGKVPWVLLFTSVFFFLGCAHHQSLPKEPYTWVYKIEDLKKKDINSWAPAFIVYHYAKSYNRIGRPSVQRDDNGREKYYIDPKDPVVYSMKRIFNTKKGTYTNYIYRVHFAKIPYRLIPFNLTAGKNVGLMVVVTVNSENRPVLVTTVHTCGCYKAIVPTQYLPKNALPKKWKSKTLNVYGEKLPAILQYKSVPSPQLMVHLRPGVHRVMNLNVWDHQALTLPTYKVISMATEPMEKLTKISANGNTTSFYHTKGILKGYVKGSVKPLETIFMSLISLDFFVGTDKIYADAAETGNPFYTSLKPWRRNDSDMWNFARFLAYWGWRL